MLVYTRNKIEPFSLLYVLELFSIFLSTCMCYLNEYYVYAHDATAINSVCMKIDKELKDRGFVIHLIHPT